MEKSEMSDFLAKVNEVVEPFSTIIESDETKKRGLIILASEGANEKQTKHTIAAMGSPKELVELLHDFGTQKGTGELFRMASLGVALGSLKNL